MLCSLLVAILFLVAGANPAYKPPVYNKTPGTAIKMETV